MVTKPIACAFWARFSKARAGFFRSAQGKKLVAKAVALVRAKEGDEEAETLRNLCTAAECVEIKHG